MIDSEIGERAGHILRAVVREYVRGGEPVGSKQLVGRYRLTYSPATVRNEMARLAELGYLSQPHTSAGRIPTDLGYRFFVDTMERMQLPGPQARRLDDELSREPESLEDLLHRTTEVLSSLTHYAAAVLAPRLSPGAIHRIDLVRIGPRTVTVVLIAEGGRVEQRMLSVDQAPTAQQIDRLVLSLERELRGLALSQARRRITELAAKAQAREREVLAGVGETLDQMIGAEDRMFVGGTSNLAEEPAFEREALHRLYEALEHQTQVLDLLVDAVARPLTIRIGSEVPVEDMRSCGVVMATYELDGRSVGSLGLIGPTRMDYQRVAALAAAAAQRLAGTLQAIAG